MDTIRYTLKVADIDGTKLFSRTKKSCSDCFETRTTNNKIHSGHSAVSKSLIGKYPRFIIDIELY